MYASWLLGLEQLACKDQSVTIAIVVVVITITILTITVYSKLPFHGFIRFTFSTFQMQNAINNK